MAERFFSTLGCELLARRRFRSQAEARITVLSYIEGFYNPLRLHAPLGYRSPIAFQQNTEVNTSSPILIEQAPQLSTNRTPDKLVDDDGLMRYRASRFDCHACKLKP